MHTKVELPKAFSVRNEREFLPIQHLMARLNPKLLVRQIAAREERELQRLMPHGEMALSC